MKSSVILQNWATTATKMQKKKKKKKRKKEQISVCGKQGVSVFLCLLAPSTSTSAKNDKSFFSLSSSTMIILYDMCGRRARNRFCSVFRVL
jgi:hypothetical protein